MEKFDMDNLFISRARTPAGTLVLASAGRRLVMCAFAGAKMLPAYLNKLRHQYAAEQIAEGTSPAIACALADISSYLDGRTATLPASTDGYFVDAICTQFQKTVYDALVRLPRGSTATYCEIARAVGRPAAVRAVAGAIAANPLVLYVPCHRVIGSDGSLRGFAGGIEAKRRLLELESKL